MSPEIHALIKLSGADPATITDPYGHLRKVIEERNVLRKLVARRDGAPDIPRLISTAERCDVCEPLGLTHDSTCPVWGEAVGINRHIANGDSR